MVNVDMTPWFLASLLIAAVNTSRSLSLSPSPCVALSLSVSLSLSLSLSVSLFLSSTLPGVVSDILWSWGCE